MRAQDTNQSARSRRGRGYHRMEKSSLIKQGSSRDRFVDLVSKFDCKESGIAGGKGDKKQA